MRRAARLSAGRKDGRLSSWRDQAGLAGRPGTEDEGPAAATLQGRKTPATAAVAGDRQERTLDGERWTMGHGRGYSGRSGWTTAGGLRTADVGRRTRENGLLKADA